jgi:hypothetical protein
MTVRSSVRGSVDVTVFVYVVRCSSEGMENPNVNLVMNPRRLLIQDVVKRRTKTKSCIVQLRTEGLAAVEVITTQTRRWLCERGTCNTLVSSNVNIGVRSTHSFLFVVRMPSLSVHFHLFLTRCTLS